jgi:hypothetical protein
LIHAALAQSLNTADRKAWAVVLARTEADWAELAAAQAEEQAELKRVENAMKLETLRAAGLVGGVKHG